MNICNKKRIGRRNHIPGDGIFFMGVGRPNFGRGVKFFARRGCQIFFDKMGGKGVGKIFLRKISKVYRFFLAILMIFSGF